MNTETSKRPIISIDKGTLIHIGLVITIVSLVVTATWFFSSLNSKVENQEQRIMKLEDTITDLATIKQDVSAMKVNIDWIKSVLSNVEISQ